MLKLYHLQVNLLLLEFKLFPIMLLMLGLEYFTDYVVNAGIRIFY